jgi:hypothetical protein
MNVARHFRNRPGFALAPAPRKSNQTSPGLARVGARPYDRRKYLCPRSTKSSHGSMT